MPLDGFAGLLTLVMDPANNVQSLYTNGVLAGSASLNGKRLSGLRDLHTWLGRSLYSGDAGLSGSIDEFRIYSGALSPAQITADFTAGPDSVVLPSPRAALNIARSGNNIVISWPTGGPAVTLQSSPTIAPSPSWTNVNVTPVVVNGMNQVTVPIGPGNTFYRLTQ
jgi:hypothetical protein